MPADTEIGLLRYNSLPPLFPHVLDLPEDHYRRAGVTRLHNHDRLDVGSIRPGDLIFVKTDGLSAFTKALAHIPVPFGLVTGISDTTPHDFADLAKDERVVSWSGANLPLWSDKILQLPIGFTERERPHGDQTAILAAVGGLPWDERPIDVLLTAMADTAPERHAIPTAGVHRCEERLGYADYLRLLGRSRYVICPRGHGVDTLRFWETLAVGAVPVVRTSILDPLYRACGGLIVDDWAEMQDRIAAHRASGDGPAGRDRALAAFAARDGVFFIKSWERRIRDHHARLMAARKL
ncbi:hypothetical protein [Azospirillum sp. TSO35-2]|uniref:hypothetical protein n=1 Tax=Azospirillum sp. TSO35-2 TaxID=716796 RepID=UPI000D608E48|nr:hypothetical protein [Azospirillum sp. TSO35-2]PWC32576.1 hypothetical protein TSO352_18120 [Azospirillum sp. TSO35-2]